MNKTYTIISIITLSLIFISLVYLQNTNIPENREVLGEYQGPIPQGYDEQYFRNTGITKPLIDKT
jgi:hypothetical protein